MKSSFSPDRLFGCVEPLESRIAPAVIRIGAPPSVDPSNPQDTEYDEGTPGHPDGRPAPFNALHFVNTGTSSDAISQAVGTSATQNTYYLRLSAGDEVQYYSTEQPYEKNVLLKVSSGQAIAFFVDFNQNNEYDFGELTGLSLGKTRRCTCRKFSVTSSRT